ncbi:MAG: hypothetical protein JSV56_03270 [Methanomassiliicoccales archaeon]|nr:MAG: hypothetical protein JSV56_03270 [Methanomassiliicoccales archaeon]
MLLHLLKGGSNIWLPINEALDKYKQYRHLITASNYITPFNVVSETDVKHNFNSNGKVSIFSKTPSIGGNWATHPSFKYSSDQNDIFETGSVFSKVSSKDNIMIEKENLIKMKEHLPVPEFLGFFKNREEDISELLEMKSGCKIAALLVEEFIDSISLGQALIEERINADALVENVLETLKKMHKFCAHRDLKHSHIRINLDPKTAENLARGYREELDVEIEGVFIIDVETTKMGNEFSNEEFKLNIKTDITQLLTSITGYMSTLEYDIEVIKKFFPTPIAQRLKRYGAFLDAVKAGYDVELSHRFLPESKTTKFLIDRLGS